MVEMDSEHMNPSGLTIGSPPMDTCNPVQSSQYWPLVAPRTFTAPKRMQMTSDGCKTCTNGFRRSKIPKNEKKIRPKPTFWAKVMAIYS